MKKFLAMAFIAASLVACNNSGSKKETKKDTTVTAPVDTTKKPVDTTSKPASDTSKPKM